MAERYSGGYPMQAGNQNRRKNIDFSQLHRDSSGYYNICFHKPELNFNIQEAKAVFEEYGKIPIVHTTAKTVFIRFEERDAAEAALLALMDSDQFKNLMIPSQRHSTSNSGGGKGEQDVIVRNLPETVTEAKVRDMVNDYNPVKVALQVKGDKIEALVQFPNEEKAKEFVGTLESGVVGELLPARKNKVEPLGGGKTDEGPYYDMAGNVIQPLESEARVVELWVENYPDGTTKEEIEKWLKKYGGTTHVSMKEKKDKDWGYTFVGVKSANQAERVIRELNKKKVGAFTIKVELTQSEQMAAGGYGGYGDGSIGTSGCGVSEFEQYEENIKELQRNYKAACGGGVSDMQQDEGNIKELQRNYKLQRANHLAHAADFMLNEVLDDRQLCSLVANAMQELCSVLDSLLPPDSIPPPEAHPQGKGAVMSPSEHKSHTVKQSIE